MASSYFDTLSREHLLLLIISALAVLTVMLAYTAYFSPRAPSGTHITTESANMLIEIAWAPTS